MRAVNLIPAEDRPGAGGLAGRSGGVVYVVAGGLAGLVALGVVYASSVHTVASRKGELASLTEQVAAVNAQSQSLAPYVQVAATIEQKVQATVSLTEQRFNWPAAMQQLALAVPDDDPFTGFSASVTAGPTASVGGSTTGGVPFSLSGCANSQGEIPALLTDLASVPAVSDVQLVSTVENPGLRYHALATTLNGGGPVGADLPSASSCPKITWSVTLNYATSYTVPKVKLPQGSSSGAQTVSATSGAKAPIVETASQQVTR